MFNGRPTIAKVGLPRYLDAIATMTGSSKDWKWFDAQAAMLEADPPEITKKEIYEAMGITAATLDKYLTLRKIERVQNEK